MGDSNILSRRTWMETLAFSVPALGAAMSAPRPPQQPAQPYISIRDYGAVGDGHADDAPALLRALDATRSTAATLFLPPGGYRCGRLVQAKTPCRIAGVGEQSQLIFDRDLPFSPPFRSLFVEGGQNAAPGEDFCHLRDFAIIGQSNGPEGRKDNLLAGLGLQYVSGYLEGITLRKSWGMAIVYHGCHDLAIQRCHVESSGRDGITGFWGNQRIWIIDNWVQGPGDDGIAFNASDERVGNSLAEDIYIAGNLIENGRFFGRGIYLAGVTRAHVVNNSVRSVVSSGIAVMPSLLTKARSMDVEITGNRVSDAGALPTSGQPLVGIRADSADGLRIQNNVVELSGAQGIFALNCTDLVLSANVVTRWGKFNSAPGLDLRSVKNLTVMGNHVADGSGPVVLLEAPRSVRLLGNYAASNNAQLLQVRGEVTDVIACRNLFVGPHSDARTAFGAHAVTSQALVMASNTIIASKGSRREFDPALRVSSNDVIDSQS